LILLFSVVCLVSSQLPAQSKGTPIGKLKQYDVVSINQLIGDKKNSANDLQTINLGDFGDFELDLFESQIISKDYIRISETENGPKSTTKLPGIKTFIGIVKGKPSSTVALTVNNDFVHGFIKVASAEINIEPLRYYDPNASLDELMIYQSSDQKHLTKSHCGIDHKVEQQFKDSVEQQKESKSLDGCIEVDMAIASDYSMLEYYGSVREVEYHAIAILNAVQTNYDTEFDDEIRFNLVEQYISSCESCDPWTDSSDSQTLLEDFREWTQEGWEKNVDQSSLWSKRDYSRAGNTAANGLAWINTVCTTHASMIVEDNDTGERKRVLFAHELGHNFGASHDESGTNFIMSTPLAETNEWSEESKSSINRRTLRFACLTSCERSENVVADFDLEFIGRCAPINVQFRNTSFGKLDSVKWIFPGGNPTYSTELEPIVNYGVGGSFPVRLEIFGANGTSDILEKRDLITFGQIPSTSFSYNMTADNRINFTIDNPLDNTEYTWDFNDGTSSKELNPTHVFEQISGAKVKLTASNDCGTSFTENVLSERTLMPPVADFASSDRFLCIGESIQFVNLSENTDSVSWFFQGAAPFNTSIENPVVMYPEGGSFAVGLIAINALAADSIAISSYITVDPEPVSNFSFQIDDKTVSFVQSSEYVRSILWDFGDGTNSDEIHPSHTYTNPGEYEVTLIVENHCSTDIHAQKIVIDGEKPIASFDTSSIEQCAGGSVLFRNTSDNATEYQWTFEGGNPSTSTDASPVIAYMDEGVFTVTLKAINSNGESVIVKENLVRIGGRPNVSFDYSINGREISFVNTSANSESSLWNFGDGSVSTQKDPVYTFQTDGNYEVSLTSTNDCGSNTTVKTIAIDAALPIAALEVNSNSICTGSVARFSNTSQNTSSIQWIFDGGIPNRSNDESPSVLYINSGEYDVILIVQNANGTDTIQFANYINVSNQPRALFESESNNNVVTFTNLSENGIEYFWNFGDGTFSADKSPVHSFREEDSYTVSLRVTNGCGNSEISRTISIENMGNGESPNTTPIVTDFNLSETEACTGQAIQVTNLSTEADSTIFFIDDTIRISNNEFRISTAGEYTVSMYVYRNNQVEQIDKKIIVRDSPSPAFTFERVGTTNDIQFINESTNATSYIWSFGDEFSSAFANPVHSFAEDKPYEVKLIASNSCSSTEITQTVDIGLKDKPNALFSVSQQQICKGQSIVFELLDTIASDVEWFFEGGSIPFSTEKSVVVQYDDIGRFDVRLISSNFNGSKTSYLSELITVSDVAAVDINTRISGLEVRFGATNVTGASYKWDFGDGNTSELLNPVHNYNQPGDFVITLSVDLPCGQISLSEKIVIVEDSESKNILPKALFSFTNDKVNTGGRIRFSSISENADSVQWIFEGAEPSTSTEDELIVQYDIDGIFDVILIAHNEYGSDTLFKEDFVEVEPIRSAQSSETRELESNESSVETVLSPNPFTDRFNININSEILGMAKVFLYNSAGALMHKEQFYMSSNHYQYTVDTPDLMSGMYVVRIIVGDDMIQQKIIKL